MNPKDNPVVYQAITWLPLGGVERSIAAFAPRLRARGWDVRIVCLREEGPLGPEIRAAGIPITVIPQRSRLSPAGIWALARHFRQESVSVIHAHMYRSNIPTTLAGRVARTPVILGTVHNINSWDSWRQRLTERYVAPLRTSTIAVSEAVRRDVLDRIGSLRPDQVRTLYNGIDTHIFRPDGQRRRKQRDLWNLRPDEVLLVVPARFHSQKNPLIILRAFGIALQSNAPGVQNLRLAFVGRGPMEQVLRAAVTESGLTDRVLLPGPSNDMPSVYNAADAVVLGSLREGFSLSLIEALACGRPALVSEVGGNREALGEGGLTGWLHRAGDEATLAGHMCHAAALGVEGLRRMESACRLRSENFNLDKLVENTHLLYGNLLGRFPQ